MYEDLEKENEVEKEKLKSINEKFFQLHKDFEDLKQAHQKEKEKLKKDRVENVGFMIFNFKELYQDFFRVLQLKV